MPNLDSAIGGVISSFGRKVTFRRTTDSYNVATGATARTTADTVCWGVVASDSGTEGTQLVASADIKVTLFASELSVVIPATSDVLVIDGFEYEVLSIQAFRDQMNHPVTYVFSINGDGRLF